MRGPITAFLILACSAVGLAADEVPEAFVPFEHMVGGWKGSISNTSNRVKGWPESHAWAWKFEKGVPVGMSLTLEGNKTLSKGLLTFDPAAKKYRLDGTDPEDKPIAFVGPFLADKGLLLDRVGTTADGKERLTFKPNSNMIRYNYQLERQEKGAPQYKIAISGGLTKDGENFAAGGAESNLPKCILTGGAASMTVSYMGKSFPICCTGCRDEFNENPGKYSKKAAAMALAEPAQANPTVSTPAAPKATTGPAMKTATKSEATKTKDDVEGKATRELNLAQNFEKNGKKSLALEHYRKTLKDFPDTEAAKVAAARIKAIAPN